MYSATCTRRCSGPARATGRIASLLVLSGWWLGLPLAAQPAVHPEELQLKPKIDQAIERGVQFLIDDQLRDGTWGRYGNYDGGKAALCAYALLKCGVASDHPAVRRALLYIDRIDPEQTYTIACMMLAYAATGRPRYQDRLEALTKKLIGWQRSGAYGYPHHHGSNEGWSRPDLSNMQYAALGLWIAQKHKISVPAAVWRRLQSATMKFQAKPEEFEQRITGKHTTAIRKGEVRGFGYVPRSKATGSMTTAGAAILQICKLGLGERLAGAERRETDRAIEQAIDWLGRHFRVDKNPGKGGWTYYYLYGLERVGSLVRVEQMGDHWWYLRGARQILKWQEKNGSWNKGSSGHVQVKTAFALLFLRRATSFASVTGGSNAATSNKQHIFSAGGAKAAVAIGGAGQQPLNLWIKDFGAEVKKRHEQYGLRVLQVEYLDGKRILGQLAGNPLQAWTVLETFLHRAAALQRGDHQIKARITLVKPEVPPGSTSPTEVVESPVMRVRIRDVFAEWMEAAHEIRGQQLDETERTVTASSDPKHAGRAFDGNDATHWVCAKDDAAPEITVTTKRAVLARKLVFTQAGSRVRDLGTFDRITAVDVFINKAGEPMRVELNPDQLAVTVVDLPRQRQVRSLRVRVVERVPGRQRGRAGFSEIGLVR